MLNRMVTMPLMLYMTTTVWLYGRHNRHVSINITINTYMHHITATTMILPDHHHHHVPHSISLSYEPVFIAKSLFLGRRYGCHSCGKRQQQEFIADHIPPNKLVKFYERQKFYPQCKLCSQKQGNMNMLFIVS